MPARGRTPEKRVRVRSWTHDKVQDGKERDGWVSGDVCVLLSHVGEGKSKPCEKELLGSNAPCPGCELKRAREDLGYVPLRRNDGRPMCVVVRQSRLDFVCEIKPGTPVIWWRDPGRFDGVSLRPNLKGLPWDRFYSERAADDLSSWLSTFLGVPHLADALRVYLSPRECQPIVTDPVPAPAHVEPAAPALVNRVEKVEGPDPFTMALDRTTKRLRAKQERMRDAEKNGHAEEK